jgi:hypothetical protein
MITDCIHHVQSLIAPRRPHLYLAPHPSCLSTFLLVRLRLLITLEAIYHARRAIDPFYIENPHPCYLVVPPVTAGDADVHVELCVKSSIMFRSPPLGGVA